jgi:hypothetical protein
VLGLLRPVTDITNQNPSIASEVFLNFVFLLDFQNPVRAHAVDAFFPVLCALFYKFLFVEFVLLS